MMNFEISSQKLETHEKLVLVVLLTETGLGFQAIVTLIESVFPESFDPELVKLCSGTSLSYEAGGDAMIEAAARAKSASEKAFYSLLSISYYLGVSTGEGARWFMKAGFEMPKTDELNELAAAVALACKEENPWDQIGIIVQKAGTSRQVQIIRNSLPIFHQVGGNIAKWVEFFATSGKSFMKDKR